MARSNMIRGLLLVVFGPCFFLMGCATVQKHNDATRVGVEREMTVGVVQREIRKGMSAAEVAVVLGSPNIVTIDSERREVWIYDKISTDVTYSKTSGGATALLIWGKSSAGAQSKTQRTLTVIIKFDENKTVRDFAYHSSRF